jgi:GT2 family glycosyltransferase
MPQTHHFELVVVAYKSRTALIPFLEDLGVDVPVILVDNSTDHEDLSDLLAEYPDVRHIDSGGNLGYSAASNMGAQAATAEFLIFMNPDTRPTAAALGQLVDFLESNTDVACCGAAGTGTAGGGAQPTPARTLTHSLGLHRRFPLAGIYYQDLGGRRVDVGWVAGSCLAIRRATFNKLGGFDPRYFVYQSDFDLGLRMQQRGLRQVVLGDVIIPHTDGGSSDLPQLWTWEKRGRAWTRFLRKTRNLPSAMGISALLLIGYAARALLYTVSGQSGRAREVASYLRAGLAEWVNPE